MDDFILFFFPTHRLNMSITHFLKLKRDGYEAKNIHAYTKR